MDGVAGCGAGAAGVADCAAGRAIPWASVACLCIGFEGWLFGGLNLAWPTAHQIQAGLFHALIDLVVNTKLHIIHRIPQVVVVTILALRVNDHPRRQEQDAPRHHEVQPHLGFL